MRIVARSVNVLHLVLYLMILTGCRSVFPPALAPSSGVALRSSHDERYVVAQGKDESWSLTQSAEPDDCARFSMIDLGKNEEGNRTIALKTCWNRFVTAPRIIAVEVEPQWFETADARLYRMVWQESRPGDCAQFTLVEQNDNTVAFKTCGGRYLTAGDAGVGWEGSLNWTVIVENPIVEDWEKFILQELP